MTSLASLASLIGSFAVLLVPHPDNAALLRQWTAGARAADLPTCTPTAWT